MRIESPLPRVALRPEEAAASLGGSRDTFDLHSAPELPMVRLGRVKLFPLTGLQAWAEEHAEILIEEFR